MKRTVIATACALALGATGVAHAQTAQEMKQQIDLLQRQVDLLKNRLDQMAAPQKAAPVAPAAVASDGGSFLERKAGDGVTFKTRGGEVSVYGLVE